MDLENEVTEKIGKLISIYGKESNHISNPVLKLNDDQMFNLEGGRYATEISFDNIIDNSGHSYHHESLSLEQRCEIIDSFL